MISVAYSDIDSYIKESHQEFVLDLTNSTLLEVLKEYQNFKKIRKHKGTYGGLLYRLSKYPTLMPVQVTDIFWQLFQKELLDDGLKLSSITEYCDQLHAVLNWGNKHGCLLSTTYADFNRFRYKSVKVALTPDQISHIYHYNLRTIKCRADHRKTLERARDMFVLSCSLGQRYSDMKRITKDSFINPHTMRIIQQKTASEAIVDIDKFAIDKRVARDILIKYDYNAPYSGDISNYNKLIKELISIIGEEFNDVVTTEFHDGEKVVKQSFTVKSKISSHTARRTFVTNNIRFFTDREIMRATGHREQSTLEKYKIDGYNSFNPS